MQRRVLLYLEVFMTRLFVNLHCNDLDFSFKNQNFDFSFKNQNIERFLFSQKKSNFKFKAHLHSTHTCIYSNENSMNAWSKNANEKKNDGRSQPQWTLRLLLKVKGYIFVVES